MVKIMSITCKSGVTRVEVFHIYVFILFLYIVFVTGISVLFIIKLVISDAFTFAQGFLLKKVKHKQNAVLR